MKVMEAGFKIRHKNWWWGRYVKLEGKRVVDESGNAYAKSDFNDGVCDFWRGYCEATDGAHNEPKQLGLYRAES